MNDKRKATQDLVVLIIGRKPLEWRIPKTEGIPPGERICATLDYFEEAHLLVLYGGRDDKRYSYNDIWVMDLERFAWLRVSVYDLEPSQRSEHCSLIWANKYIVFGGMNKNDYYIGSDIYEITLGKVF